MRLLETRRRDRVQRTVEHERDAGELLDGAVVKEEGEPAALVLLGQDQAVEDVVVGASPS